MQSIVVQPEVVVETTTYNGSDSASGRSTPTKSHSGAITTKVRFFQLCNIFYNVKLYAHVNS